MLYAIIAEDVPGSLDKRLAARPAHLERLKALQDAGRMILAGPCPAIDSPDPGPAGFTGSLIVAEFDSLQDAKTWADADPFVAAGVYAKVTVTPFRKTLPAGAMSKRCCANGSRCFPRSVWKSSTIPRCTPATPARGRAGTTAC